MSAAQLQQLTELVCKRCGHRWIPRVVVVRICPKCKSAYWDMEIIRKGKG